MCFTETLENYFAAITTAHYLHFASVNFSLDRMATKYAKLSRLADVPTFHVLFETYA